MREMNSKKLVNSRKVEGTMPSQEAGGGGTQDDGDAINLDSDSGDEDEGGPACCQGVLEYTQPLKPHTCSLDSSIKTEFCG